MPGNRFLREDGIWSIAYESVGARLVELKGFHDIARLLEQHGEPLHCLELSGAAADTDAPAETPPAETATPAEAPPDETATPGEAATEAPNEL